jgi:hypothetical protein
MHREKVTCQEFRDVCTGNNFGDVPTLLRAIVYAHWRECLQCQEWLASEGAVGPPLTEKQLAEVKQIADRDEATLKILAALGALSKAMMERPHASSDQTVPKGGETPPTAADPCHE